MEKNIARANELNKKSSRTPEEEQELKDLTAKNAEDRRKEDR